MVLVVAALIAALAGTAVAVDKITSKDIKPNAVRSKHIKRGQVKASDTDVVKFGRAGGETSVAPGSEIALTPRIRLRAKAGDLLRVHLAVTVRLDGSLSNDCFVRLRVQGPPGDFDRTVIDASPSDPVTVYMDGSADGSTNLADLIGRDVPIPQTGRYTLSMRYSSAIGGDPCAFSGRRLWIEHSR